VTEPKIPPVVTKRNEFTSLQARVEDALYRFPEEGRVMTKAEMRRSLLTFAEQITLDCMFAYQKGADKGIEQAAHLMNDPDYYETVKARRKRSAERQKEWDEQQRTERLERDHDPVYRAKHITDLHKWLDDAKVHVEEISNRLTEYLKQCEEPPKLVRLPMPDNVPNWTIKGFGQTIDTGVQGSFAGLQAVPDKPTPEPEAPGTIERVK
jgi:hypothetical protein